MKDHEIRIEGYLPDKSFIPTGLWSFDRAIGFEGEWGLPLRAIYELYGRPGCGKSTLAQYLAACISTEGHIVIMDSESALEPKYLKSSVAQAGFHGTVKIVDSVKEEKGKREVRSHEEMLDETADALGRDEVNAVIVDSIGMLMSRHEEEGTIGERHMGRRAFDVAQFSRRALAWLRNTERPKAAFAVNHVLDLLGTVPGHYTPGGMSLKFAAAARIMMWRKETDFPDGCFMAECGIEKLRIGGQSRQRKARIFFIPGLGVSVGMTAVFDCFAVGLAERGNYVKLGSKKIGRLKALLVEAQAGDPEPFQPFIEALAGYTGEVSEEEDEPPA